MRGAGTHVYRGDVYVWVPQVNLLYRQQGATSISRLNKGGTSISHPK